MPRVANYAKKLRKIASTLEELASEIKSLPAKDRNSNGTRKRRSKKEVAALKKMLKAERKAGVPVAELAAKHGVSTAYI